MRKIYIFKIANLRLQPANELFGTANGLLLNIYEPIVYEWRKVMSIKLIFLQFNSYLICRSTTSKILPWYEYISFSWRIKSYFFLYLLNLYIFGRRWNSFFIFSYITNYNTLIIFCTRIATGFIPHIIPVLDALIMRLCRGFCGLEIVRKDEFRPENPSLASSSTRSLFHSFFHLYICWLI